MKLARILRRLFRDKRGSADLNTYLLLTAAGCTMVGLTAPHLFKSSKTASDTFEKQVEILERGAGGGGGSGSGFGGGGLGGGGWDLSGMGGLSQLAGSMGGGGGGSLTNGGGNLTGNGSQLANGGSQLAQAGATVVSGTGVGGNGGNANNNNPNNNNGRGQDLVANKAP
jgi:hypothetical protein